MTQDSKTVQPTERQLRAMAQLATHQDPEVEDVRDFQEKFGQLSARTPRMLTRRKLLERIRFMQEELDELKKAETLDDMFDALLDLVYVAKGTAVMMGLPWRAGWDLVHGKNMQKVPGQTHRGNLVDVAKPPGWTPPDHLPLLEAAGWALGAGKQATIQANVASAYKKGDGYPLQYLADDQVHLDSGEAWVDLEAPKEAP